MSNVSMLIVDYCEEWIADFKALKETITCRFRDFDYSIEHIGSTAVPGMAAKPIIDIDVVYYADDDFQKIREALVALNYYHNGDQGIEGREVFKRSSGTKHPVLDQIRHHLYVCPDDSEELKKHLIIRDYLRAHAEVREDYIRRKKEIARTVQQDRKAYAQHKQTEMRSFFDGILKKHGNGKMELIRSRG